jgi:hypothetical protein
MFYRGEITATSNEHAPFLVTVTDEIGHVFGTFPASTRAEAEGRALLRSLVVEPILFHLRSLGSFIRCSTMLMPDSPLEPEQMLALSYAFDAACRDLGIGEGSLDVAKREKLARVILRFVRKGETDIDVLHRRAVIHLRNTSPTLRWGNGTL